jgi:hypothetical protein
MSFNYKKNKLDQLKGFCTLVECGNINDAAIKNSISATTISKQISSLEEDLGFKLFNKIKNRLVLNEKGKAYYKEAKKILLDLDKIYGGKIGIKKISGFKIFLLKVRNEYLHLKDKLFKFIKKMFIKIKLQHLIVFLIFITITSCFTITQSIQNSFHKKVTKITKNIALSIDYIENQQRMTLTAATHAFRERVKHHPNPTSDDLKKWALQFGVSGLEIFVKTKPWRAKMIASSFELNNKQKDHYSDHKLTTDEEESTYLNYDIKYEPFRRDITYNGIALHSTQVVWYKDINSWLNAIYFDYDINKALKKSLEIDKIISSISIVSPSGKKMFSTHEINNYNSDISFNYDRVVTFNEKNDFIDTYIPFGEIYKLKSYQERSPSLLNSNGEYFYVLNVSFDKKEINHEIFVVRLISIIISVFLLLGFYSIFRKK